MPWTWLLLPQIKNAKLFYILRFLLALSTAHCRPFPLMNFMMQKEIQHSHCHVQKKYQQQKIKFCSGWNQQYSERTLRTRRKSSERKSAMAKLKIFFWQVLNYDDDFLHSHSMSHRSDFVDCHFSKALLHILVGL